MIALFLLTAAIAAPPTMMTSSSESRPGMVNVKTVAPTVVVNMRYARTDNFLGRAFYERADATTCWLRPETAAKIARAEAEVSAKGYHLLIWDCLRPLSYQYEMWSSCVEHHSEDYCKNLVANPNSSPSTHTYGTTVDLGIAGPNGEAITLPSKFDSGLYPGDVWEDHQRSRPPVGGGAGTKPTLWSQEAWENYQVLWHAMMDAGFTGIGSEWWHYRG